MPSPSDDGVKTADEKRDRPGDEMADDALVWRVYANVAKEVDKEKVEGWNRGLDTLALFAGLFSAVTTAFIIESQKLLQPDFTELTFLALTTNASYAASTKAAFRVAPSDRAVNCLWLVSLMLSLCAALIAILGKDWIAAYTVPDRHNLREWTELRQFRFEAVARWYMPTIIAAAPILLHISLLLFAVGLAASFMIIDHVTAYLTASLAAVIAVLYAATALTPVFSNSSPFRSPSTLVLRRLLSACLSRWSKPSNDGWHDLPPWPSSATLCSALVWLRFSGASDAFRFVFAALGDLQLGQEVSSAMEQAYSTPTYADLLNQIRARVEQAAFQDGVGHTELGTLLRVGRHTSLRARTVGTLARRAIEGAGATNLWTEDDFLAHCFLGIDYEIALQACKHLPLHVQTLEVVVRDVHFPPEMHAALSVLEARSYFHSDTSPLGHLAAEVVHLLPSSYLEFDWERCNSNALAMRRLSDLIRNRECLRLGNAKVAFKLLLRLGLNSDNFVSAELLAYLVTILASNDDFVRRLVWDDREWNASEVFQTLTVVERLQYDATNLQLASEIFRTLTGDTLAANKCCNILYYAFKSSDDDSNVTLRKRSLAVAEQLLGKSTLAVLNVAAQADSLLCALIRIGTFFDDPQFQTPAVCPIMDNFISSSATLEDGTRCSWELVEDLPNKAVGLLAESPSAHSDGDVTSILKVLRTLKERHSHRCDWKQLAENLFFAISRNTAVTHERLDTLRGPLEEFYADMGFRAPRPVMAAATTEGGSSGHVAITIGPKISAVVDVTP